MIEDSQHERLRLLRALFPELAARVDSAHEAAAGAGANAGARLDARRLPEALEAILEQELD